MQDLEKGPLKPLSLPASLSASRTKGSGLNLQLERGRLWPLIVLDFLFLFFCFFTVLQLRFGTEAPSLSSLDWMALVALGLVNWGCLALFSVDQIDIDSPSITTPIRTLLALSVSIGVFVFLAYLSGAIEFTGVLGRGVLLGTQLGTAILAAGVRGLAHRWARRVARRAKWLVIGSDKAWAELQTAVRANGLLGEIVRAPVDSRGHCTIDMTETWQGCLLTDEPSEALVRELMQLRFQGVRIFDMIQFSERVWQKIPVSALEDRFFVLADGFSLLHQPLRLKIKRLFDIVLSLLLILATAPLLMIASLAIWIESPGAVLFRQVRVGERGGRFTIFKLRSMKLDAEADGEAKWSQENDPRVLRTGRWIRASRIDELPQLINVLRGDMSFIGPRPERPEFTVLLEEHVPFYNLRHLLKPGITGWAQVLYPYGASVEDAKRKLEYDLFYIKNQSLLLDLAILIRTARVVLLGRGR